MAHAILLSIHIAAGTAGLLLGPVVNVASYPAARGRAKPARRCQRGLSLAGPGGVLVRGRAGGVVPSGAVVADPGRRLLLRAGTDQPDRGSQTFPRLDAYVHGQAGSYIALVTALTVVALTVDGPLHGAAELIPWALPAAIGIPLSEWWRRLLTRAVASPGPASDS
jgi:hypothetical protein